MHSVKLILKVLEIPKSNYYKWKNRKLIKYLQW